MDRLLNALVFELHLFAMARKTQAVLVLSMLVTFGSLLFLSSYIGGYLAVPHKLPFDPIRQVTDPVLVWVYERRSPGLFAAALLATFKTYMGERKKLQRYF